MKPIQIAMIAALAALPLPAQLTFTLNPATETGTPAPFTLATDFSGTLFDTDTLNTCDSLFTNCLYLNSIDNLTFDPSDPAGTASYLTLDTNPFYNVLPFGAGCPGGSILSDDSTGSGAYDTCSGPIFGIDLAPNTPVGVYTGEITIYGGIDDPSANNALATASWTLDVVPEPTSLGLSVLGVAAMVAARRRAKG
jgi:hypothetical protein